MGRVAEKMRQELTFLHLAVEKFVQGTGDTENRLTEICEFLHEQVQASIDDGSPPCHDNEGLVPKGVSMSMQSLRPEQDQQA